MLEPVTTSTVESWPFVTAGRMSASPRPNAKPPFRNRPTRPSRFIRAFFERKNREADLSFYANFSGVYSPRCSVLWFRCAESAIMPYGIDLNSKWGENPALLPGALPTRTDSMGTGDLRECYTLMGFAPRAAHPPGENLLKTERTEHTCERSSCSPFQTSS